jgi:hypothetical protein
VGKLRVLDSTGDTVVEWAPEDTAAVDEVEALFRSLVLTARRMAFARPAGAAADDAVQIRSFDPGAEEILIVRPIQGG